MAAVTVNIGPNGAEGEDVDCKCTKDSWPLVLICLGFGVSFITVLVSVLAILQLSDIVLAIYIGLLSLLALMAEFRRIKFLRGLFYHVLKFVYFLTNYYCRGFYYIFLGSIVITSTPLNIIAGCANIAFGLCLMIVHTTVGLPNYIDPQVVKEEAEYAAARAAACHGPILGVSQYTPASSVAPTPTAAAPYSPVAYTSPTENANPYAQQQPASNPAYVPSTAAVGTSAYVPPSASTAYMSNNTNIEDPYGEEPIAAAPTSRARMNNDDALAAAYYAQQQPQTRASKADPDDPFARSDNQYRPNRQ